jgi:aryl-alcohol dehydrogenase-like predicted oxidoreductase
VFSGRDMATLSRASVAAAVDVSRQRLGVDKIDLLQFYWADYGYDRCGYNLGCNHEWCMTGQLGSSSSLVWGRRYNRTAVLLGRLRL